jgi:hypothetical protein
MAYIMTNGLSANDFALAPATAKTGAAKSDAGKGWFASLIDAVTRSRMIKAEREIARYRQSLPVSEQMKIDLSENSLPFRR